MSQTALTSQIDETSTLRSVIVRPITARERSNWDMLMAKHHYLSLKSLVGKSIRYVAELQGHWVALLGWSAAASQSTADNGASKTKATTFVISPLMKIDLRYAPVTAPE
jgi:hypothetical protein